MKQTDLLAPPKVTAPLPPLGKWEQEFRAFLRLRPSLRRSRRNRFVAAHRGEVVDSGEDKVALGLRVYAEFGYVPIYVGRVSSKPSARGARAQPAPGCPNHQRVIRYRYNH